MSWVTPEKKKNIHTIAQHNSHVWNFHMATVYKMFGHTHVGTSSESSNKHHIIPAGDVGLRIQLCLQLKLFSQEGTLKQQWQ